MKHWSSFSLEDLCSDIVDCVNKTAPLSPQPTPYKMLRTSDIRGGVINLEGLNCVTEDTFAKWTRRCSLQYGDVIFTREAPLGEVGFVKHPENYFLGQRLVLFRTNPALCDSRFLLYALLHHDNKATILSKGVGSTVQHLRVPECRKITIKAPPLETQQKIADILSAYDDLIDNNQQQMKLLEEAVKLYLSNFFKENNSHNWTTYSFPEVFDVIRGRSYKSADITSSEGKLFVNLKNIKAWGGYKRNAEKRYSGEFQHCQKLIPGDIIMGMTDMTQDRRLVGHVAKIPHLGEDAIFSMDIAKLVPKVGSANYLYYYLRYSDVSTSIANLANGVNVLHLRPDSLKSIMLQLPSDKLIAKFDAITGPIAEQIELLEDSNQLLQEARDRLLPKLLSGEIEV